MGADDVERLRLVLPPVPYSALWLTLAILAILAALGWLAGVLVWTLPMRRLRSVPVLQGVALRLIKRKFRRSIDETVQRHQRGQLTSRAAHGSISATLRQFLEVWTGEPASRMVLAEIAESPVADAAPVIETLYPGEFGPEEQPDVERSARAAKEVIERWR